MTKRPKIDVDLPEELLNSFAKALVCLRSAPFTTATRVKPTLKSGSLSTPNTTKGHPMQARRVFPHRYNRLLTINNYNYIRTNRRYYNERSNICSIFKP